MSSIGRTWEKPPPAAPPFIPNVGPMLGSRRANACLIPSLPNACAKPIEVQVLPSPAGVGVIAVTKINFPSGLSLTCSQTLFSIFALYFPYCSSPSRSISSIEAISGICFIDAFCEISISEGMLGISGYCASNSDSESFI